MNFADEIDEEKMILLPSFATEAKDGAPVPHIRVPVMGVISEAQVSKARPEAPAKNVIPAPDAGSLIPLRFAWNDRMTRYFLCKVLLQRGKLRVPASLFQIVAQGGDIAEEKRV